MTARANNQILEAFENPEHAARYADGPAKFVPGFNDLHRMANVLIRERVSENAHVLIHGAGGGLELKAFAAANNRWTFVGIDPAKAMLDEAITRLGDMSDRVTPHCGFIDDAPEGPFDAATSFLTLHFLDIDARRETVREIVRRLKPGAPFIAAHTSFPQNGSARELWLSRYEAFAIASGVDPEMARGASTSVSDMLPVLTLQEDLDILENAGLQDVTSFYSAFMWQGWVGYAP